MKRRTLIAALPGALAALHLQAAPSPVMEVWKDPDCGCCKDWIKHLQTNGFQVKVHDSGNEAMRKQLGMPDKLGSCHTARIANYVIEGHVPGRDIQRLLREKPKALGLAVPGMPVGSPGMDGPEYKGRKTRYSVLLIAPDGSTQIYQTYS